MGKLIVTGSENALRAAHPAEADALLQMILQTIGLDGLNLYLGDLLVGYFLQHQRRNAGFRIKHRDILQHKSPQYTV